MEKTSPGLAAHCGQFTDWDYLAKRKDATAVVVARVARSLFVKALAIEMVIRAAVMGDVIIIEKS